jgi:hypothetical protein
MDFARLSVVSICVKNIAISFDKLIDPCSLAKAKTGTIFVSGLDGFVLIDPVTLFSPLSIEPNHGNL